MKPHFWLEFPKRNVAVFSAAVAAVFVVWLFLPAEISDKVTFRTLRSGPLLWIGSWFTLLFVRAEDLNLQAPMDVQGVVRFSAICSIILSVISNGITLIQLADSVP